jgi:hypothetical protein
MQERASDITLRRAEVHKSTLSYLVSIIGIKQSKMADNQLEPVQQTAFHQIQVER